MFVMSGAVVCQAVSVRVVGDDRLKVIFGRSVRQIINDVSAAEAAGCFSPKRGRGFQCSSPLSHQRSTVGSHLASSTGQAFLSMRVCLL